jgi:soluble lytic murein transglycosylase-like protein
MDIWADLSAIQQRIAEIAGVPAAAIRPAAAGRFTAAVGQALADAPTPVPRQRIDRLVRQNAKAWHVDPALIAAVIASESSFNAAAGSPAGAAGLMQLMPATAASLGVRNPYDPAQNVAGGTRYLRSLLDRFNGDTRLAVAAYNAGPDAVEKYGAVPPYAETRTYVRNVLGSLGRYRAQP